jgi:antitoxin (DNA-binding transcriptional repressor) of toxin-antitoxin stability system
MKFLSVRDLRSKSAEVWKGLTAEREMVVTSNGRPIAILSAVTEETLEETMAAIRKSRAVAAASELQRQSVQKGKSLGRALLHSAGTYRYLCYLSR